MPKQQKNQLIKTTHHDQHPTKINQDHSDPDTINSVPFPSSQNSSHIEPTSQIPDDNDESDNYSHGQCARKPPGAYESMNDGLIAALLQFEDPKAENSLAEISDEDFFDLLPPDFSLTGGLDTEPNSIDEALCGSEAKEWQEVLQYEIGQLEKLKTWAIKDLPPKHKAIPSSEVL